VRRGKVRTMSHNNFGAQELAPANATACSRTPNYLSENL
jgi:hypothetical protein